MTFDAKSAEPMTTNRTVGNMISSVGSPASPNMKRKASDGPNDKVASEDKENETVGKKTKVDTATPLVELKGRKLVFKQTPLSRELPRRGKNKFETYLFDEEDAQRTVTEIPEEFWDLVVKAGHELTSSNESLFAKHVKTNLGGQEQLPLEAIMALIPKLFTMAQYGFLPSDFTPSSSSLKVPAALQIRCWEANDIQKYSAPDQVEELLARRRERELARTECLRILESLDDVEKLELVKGDKPERGDKAIKEKPTKESKEKLVKGTTEKPNKDKILNAVKPDAEERSPFAGRRNDREGTATTVDSRRSASPVKRNKLTPEEEEEARRRREEREAKKAELAEKKATKEREKERKDALMAKQKQTMMGFFKSKPGASSPINRASTAGPSTVKSKEPSPVIISDYARTFRPLPPRPHVHMAEHNRWRALQTQSQDVFGHASKQATSEGQSSARELLDDHLNKFGKRRRSAREHLPKGLKTMPLYGSVAEVWGELQNAEDPRTVLLRLNNRRKFPWKTLSFDQQARPPYCGTFTKKSVVVGPRTPFAQDPIFDYSYDSADDWQDDEGGEDVDDFGEGEAKEDEEDDEDGETEGEFDDWLDDGDDAEFAPPDGEPEAFATADQSRLHMKVVKKSRDMPKRVVKLTPTWKGPVWEGRIGEDGSDGLEGYRIQLLNETPDSIDPFTFVSAENAQHFKTSFSTTAIGPCLNVRCLLSSELVSVPKEIPSTTAPTSKPPLSEAPANAEAAHNKPRAGPKVGFPDSHLEQLYRAIEGSTRIRTDLVSQLRELFETVTTKAAIEQKLKEVATRHGKTKDSQWKVKPEAWRAVGLDPPVPDAAFPAAPSSVIAALFQSSPQPVAKAPAGSSADEPMIIDS
ncbi:hypothetical protein IAU60_000824 [Kwoniella sp. DSM 27419]